MMKAASDRIAAVYMRAGIAAVIIPVIGVTVIVITVVPIGRVIIVITIGIGSIGISTFESIDNEKLSLLKRFRNVFQLAYQRFTDLLAAEMQAKEAQIESSLERVRSKTKNFGIDSKDQNF